MRRDAKRLVATLTVGALLAVISVLVPSLATPAGAYPATVCASLQVSTTTPRVGEAITVTGVNFLPETKVTLVLEPAAGNTTADDTTYTLATVTSDANGSFTTKVTLPDATTSREDFVLYASTGAPNDSQCPADPRVELSLSAAGDGAANNGGAPDSTSSSTPGATAFTGVNVLILLLIAAGLVAVGAVFTRRGRATYGTSR